MIQLNRIYNYPVKQQIMLKLLKSKAPASVKVELLAASAYLEFASPDTKLMRSFLHVYKLTTHVASLAKGLPLQ